VTAAVGAARCGLDVLLIEKYGFCGGATVAGLSGTICGLHSSGDNPRQIVFGFAGEFHARMKNSGGVCGPVPFGRTMLSLELRKQIAVGLQYDTIGESVGFFRFRESTARRLADIVAGYVASGRTNLPHEEAVRDLLLEGERPYDVADVTGLPWIEIDFPGDVARAEREVLPHLAQPAGAER